MHTNKRLQPGEELFEQNEHILSTNKHLCGYSLAN